MPDLNSTDNDFLKKITSLIEANIADEKFGVSELAAEVNMSRSNLLRKIQKSTKISASRFIRQIRLQHAKQILSEETLTVSEVSFKVGFSSTSYFIKCFREYYGYPPGEHGKRSTNKTESISTPPPNKNRFIIISGFVFSIILLTAILFIVLKPASENTLKPEKSIAVLPFINDSNDSSNVYIINGLMESILNNLQNINDLRVISRTSVEKYRTNQKTIPELAKELNVSYFVEGSGQKIGDKILLNIQLIEAASDKHLWAEQYNRDSKDIFKLQQEVAKNIATKIEAIITPAEEQQINKIPTEDLVAYDYFLKGLDLMQSGDSENLDAGIDWFKKAIERDPLFARAHAGIAISYFFKDVLFTEKKYSEIINNYADKALLLDSKLPQSLIAKALFYMNEQEYEEALPYLEKALEYNPNSALAINTLSDYYARISPNNEKYLEYALKGIRLDIAANDSFSTSIIYLHLSNALLQAGFFNEAEKYINKSLHYDPENLYSEQIRAYIQFAQTGNLKKTVEILTEAFQKDTTRLDIVQEIGIIYYFMRDYQSAYNYFKPFNEARNKYKLNIYKGVNAKIAVVYSELGHITESERYFREYKEYSENDQSLFKHLSLAVYYSYHNHTEKAIEELALFSKENHTQYLIIPLLKIDPLLDNIKDTPEFRKIISDMETGFWKKHEHLKTLLQKNNLL